MTVSNTFSHTPQSPCSTPREQTEVVAVTNQPGASLQAGSHPYTYAACEPATQSDAHCYLADSLATLLSYLRRHQITLSSLTFISLSRSHQHPVNARLYNIIEGRFVEGRWQDGTGDNQIEHYLWQQHQY